MNISRSSRKISILLPKPYLYLIINFLGLILFPLLTGFAYINSLSFIYKSVFFLTSIFFFATYLYYHNVDISFDIFNNHVTTYKTIGGKSFSEKTIDLSKVHNINIKEYSRSGLSFYTIVLKNIELDYEILGHRRFTWNEAKEIFDILMQVKKVD